MKNQPQDIIKHLQQEHKRSPVEVYLKEIIYGGNDGIVTTFAVVAGFTGAQAGNIPTFSFLTVLLFGLANLFADGASMGLGNFLSLRSEKDMYKSEEERELRELRNNPEKEKEETRQILMAKGFSRTDADHLTKIYATNESYWLQFMMTHELEMPNPTKENPVFTGFATFSAFIIFGFIPLLPYVLLTNNLNTAFSYSLFATFGALALLGLLRWRTTKENPIRSVLEIVLIGGVSASIAYFVGTLFKT